MFENDFHKHAKLEFVASSVIEERNYHLLKLKQVTKGQFLMKNVKLASVPYITSFKVASRMKFK